MALPDSFEHAVDSFKEDVGRRLKQARLDAGLSLQNVGDHVGLSRAAVGHWETGHNPIDISKLYRLARLYRTTVIALISERMSNDDLVALTRRQLQGGESLRETPSPETGVSAKPGGIQKEAASVHEMPAIERALLRPRRNPQ